MKRQKLPGRCSLWTNHSRRHSTASWRFKRTDSNTCWLCQRLITVEDILLHHGNSKEPIPTPVGYVKDLPNFVSNLLGQGEEENLLTWHNAAIPGDEIWIKTGGDYRGVDCKDLHKNLTKLLKPYKKEISNLETMHRKGTKIRVVWGLRLHIEDFRHFRCTVCTAMLVVQGNHITSSKRTISTASTSKLSLTNLEWDHRQYKLHGSNKKKRKIT